MKNSTFLPFLALILSAAALVAVLLGSPPPRDTDASAGNGGGPDSALLAQVEELAARNRAMSQRLDQLTLNQPRSESRVTIPEGLITQESFDAFRDEVRRALASRDLALEGAAGDPESAGLTAQVAETLEKIRRDEKIEKNQGWLQGRSDRLAKRMPDLAQRLGLDVNQQDLMQSALVRAYEVQAEIALAVELGAEKRGEVGEAWQGNIDQLMTSLGGFLSPQQLELYQGLSGDLFPGGSGGKGK